MTQDANYLGGIKLKIEKLLGEFSSRLMKYGIGYASEYHHSGDFHSYHIQQVIGPQPSRVIHIRGHLDLSSPSQAVLSAREMEYKSLFEARQKKIPIGEENGVVRLLFSELKVPYDAQLLEQTLKGQVQLDKPLIATDN